MSTAPRISCSTMKSLKRAARMANRSSRTCRSPSRVLMESMGREYSGLSIHVLDHFQAEARQAVHLLRGRQHTHPRYAQIAKDLRADAIGAQHTGAGLAMRD